MEAYGKIIRRIIGLSLILMSGSIFCINSVVASSGHAIQLDRYLITSDQPLSSQKDPLNQIVQIHFPKSVNTINQAIRYLLQYSGYNLASISKQSKTVRGMLRLPLPLVDRKFEPITLRDALKVLAGHTFKLVVDPVHRIILFKLKGEYKHYEKDHA